MGLLDMWGLNEEDLKKYGEVFKKAGESLDQIKLILADILEENKEINNLLEKITKK